MSIKTLLLQRSLIFQFQFTKFKGIVGVNRVLKGDEENPDSVGDSYPEDSLFICLVKNIWKGTD